MVDLDFIDVEPLPDELAHSVIARLAFENCCDSSTLIAKLARFYGAPSSATYVSVVAQALGYESNEFLRKHTLYPLLHAVARGSKVINFADRTVGFRTFFGPKVNSAATYCARCSELDTTTHSISFWRRVHHLPSVDWCPVHLRGLENFPRSEIEFATSDVKVVGEAIVSIEGTEHSKNPVLRRYGALLMAWMERDVSYRSSDACDLIIDACLSQGLSVAKGDSQRLLSDALVDSLPQSWLQKFMPGLANKTEGKPHPNLDLYLERAFTSLPIKTVALLLAYLVRSVESIESNLSRNS